MDSPHSVTNLFSQLRDGDESAANKLVERFWVRLHDFAEMERKRKIGTKLNPPDDAEDAVLSTLNSFLSGMRDGKFDLQNRDNLWSLLARMTILKIIDQGRRAAAQKRGGMVQTVSIQSENYELFIDQCPGPQLFFEQEEMLEIAMTAIEDPVLKRIAEMNLRNFTNVEIAVKLGRHPSIVSRKLRVIYERWEQLSPMFE